MDKIEAINKNICYECGAKVLLDRSAKKCRCLRCGKIQYSILKEDFYYREPNSEYESECCKIAKKENSRLLCRLLLISGLVSIFSIPLMILPEVRLSSDIKIVIIFNLLFSICLCVGLVVSVIRKTYICDMTVLNMRSVKSSNSDSIKYYVDVIVDRKMPVCIKDIKVSEEVYSSLNIGQEVLMTYVLMQHKIFSKKKGIIFDRDMMIDNDPLRK